MTFAIGDAVTWISSNAKKEGVVVAIVPPKSRPERSLMKDTGGPRPHESYVVRGGEKGRSQAHYWPLVSLLHRAEGLTSVEVMWCHQNAPRVRELMAQA